jgi:phosphoenolpyruvate---glycerone phosphotransferase subunit DhaL
MVLTSVLTAAANAVIGSADDLNQLDAQAGDGDLGVTMATAGRAVLEVLASSDDLLRACGVAVSQKAPSTCGTLFATGFLRAAKALSASPDLGGAAAVAAALEAARAGIAERGKADLGSKTMLDSLAPAAAAAMSAAGRGETYAQTLAAAAESADAGAKATAHMRAKHGRAGWLADRSSGHEDGGARLVALVLAAAATAAAPADRPA